MLDKVKPKEIYRNKKTQKLYKVIAVGTHTELDEATVYYKPLYRAIPKYRHCFRPLALFKVKFEEVDYAHIRTNTDTKG